MTPVWEINDLHSEPDLGPQIVFNTFPNKGIGQFKEPKKIPFTFKPGSKVMLKEQWSVVFL